MKYISPIETPLSLVNSGTMLFLGCSLLAATLLSGVYPAVQLSRFNPIEAIHNRLSTARIGGLSVRRALVVLQFAISQSLILATLIAASQMDYVDHADLGFNKESVMILEGNKDSAFQSRQPAFKQELLAQPAVQTVSFTSDPPTDGRNETSFSFNHIDAAEPFYVAIKVGDTDYARAFGMQMAAGHWYTSEDTSGEVVINETMARRLGIRDPQQILGKQIRIGHGRWRSIVGVVKDFKNSSLKEEVPANIIARSSKQSTLTAIRLNGNLGEGSREVEVIWNKLYPEYAFNASFMDDRIDRFYRQERRLSASYKAYTLLAIVISCLGLYGLVSFMAVQRTKEVGIRKVLGASAAHIVYLFSREFTVLVAIAFLIAAPLAYYIMHGWLEGFVYRIHITAGIFIATLVVSLAIAWATVSYRSIRAATASPVNSLKSE